MASRISLGLALTVLASGAQAATVGIQWVDNPHSSTISTPPNTVVTAQVSLQLLPDETASTFISWFVATTPFLEIGAQQALAPGWEEGQYPGPLNLAQLAFAAPTAPEILHGPLSLVLGEFDVAVSGPPGALLPLALNAAGHPLGLLDAAGGSYTWDGRYNTTYPGFVAFGDFGNPGWGTNPALGHQPTPNPLWIAVSPEPTSAALALLGAFALLRRHR